MSAATADQIRNRPILVTIPGTDLQIECKCPDPLDLIQRDLLPLETFHEVLERVTVWTVTPATREEATAAVSKAPESFVDFIDRWVCAAAVAPPIVMTDEEVQRNPTALWVEDLEADAKLAIFNKTNRRLTGKRVGGALAEFRQRQPNRAGVGPSREAVRDAAVETFAGA